MPVETALGAVPSRTSKEAACAAAELHTGTAQRCRELAPGLRICRVVNGLWQVADQERLAGGRKGEDGLVAAATAMLPYLERGQTSFDMADHYGSAEDILGTFRAAHPQREVQVLTKWCPSPGEMTAEVVREAVGVSRKRTGGRPDLLQFHWWHYHDPRYLDALRHLQACREEGLFGHLGLTNFDTAHLRVVLASGIRVVSNQVCISLLDLRAADGMSSLCLQHGVGLLAFGTLAGGLLTDRWLGRPEPSEDELATWSLQKYRRFVEAAGGWEPFQVLLRALRAVADRHGCSVACVSARYILDLPAVAGVIVGVRLGEREHLDDSQALFDLQLTVEDRADIDKALQGLRRVPGDCGDEYRKPPFLTASGDLSHHLTSADDLPCSLWGLRRVDAALAGKEKPRSHPYEGSRVFSGSVWEDVAGFCRAVRRGNTIYVSGTTATYGKEAVASLCRHAGPTGAPANGHVVSLCARAQTTFVLDKLEAAIRLLGGRGLADVVRTRVYVPNLERDWEDVAREHGRAFQDLAPPANTLVGAALVGGDYLVEIEAEALV